jgi:hypothetical protein
MRDAYEVLGVSRAASPQEVKSAYHKLSKHLHPDRGGSHDRFVELYAAYRRVLADKETPWPSPWGELSTDLERWERTQQEASREWRKLLDGEESSDDKFASAANVGGASVQYAGFPIQLIFALALAATGCIAVFWLALTAGRHSSAPSPVEAYTLVGNNGAELRVSHGIRYRLKLRTGSTTVLQATEGTIALYSGEDQVGGCRSRMELKVASAAEPYQDIGFTIGSCNSDADILVGDSRPNFDPFALTGA